MYSELLCIAYYQNNGYYLKAHRHKILGIEVDLLMQKGQELLVVEVKTVGDLDYLSNRLNKKQKIRLQRAYNELLCRYPNLDIVFHLSCVHSGKVEFFETAL